MQLIFPIETPLARDPIETWLQGLGMHLSCNEKKKNRNEICNLNSHLSIHLE
jgi:hypothetical protein